jgi:hypothetical protein
VTKLAPEHLIFPHVPYHPPKAKFHYPKAWDVFFGNRIKNERKMPGKYLRQRIKNKYCQHYNKLVNRKFTETF